MMQVGKAVGMVTLNDALMDLVTKKLVTPEEAYAKAIDKPVLEATAEAGWASIPSKPAVAARRPGAERPGGARAARPSKPSCTPVRPEPRSVPDRLCRSGCARFASKTRVLYSSGSVGARTPYLASPLRNSVSESRPISAGTDQSVATN